MSYQALARKYRPQTFRDIIGQETVVRTLKNAIDQQRIHHAYLFSGVRGVGKTTAARILAKALNCTQGPTTDPDNSCSICTEITEGIDLDVREIDAATYTQVDNIRELREVTQFQPARDRYRIFIIDEAHMLSTGAWNALLKLIEEPPPHVVFILATTEMHKVPATILSRVQRFIFRKITLDELITRLAEICEKEGIRADRGALEIIARRGEGSARDSLSLLDQIIAFSGKSITAADVNTILGLSDSTFFSRLIALIGAGDHAGLIAALQEAADSGRDFKMLYRDLLQFARSLLLLAGGANETILALSPEDLVTVRTTAEPFSYSELLRITNLLLRDDEIVNRAEYQRLAVEVALLKAATFPRLRTVEQLLGSEPTHEAPAPAKPRSPASPPQQAPRRTEEPRPSEEPPRALPKGGGDDLSALIEHVQKTRPLLGSYLAGAKERRREGDRIIFVFDDSYFTDSVIDARSAIEDIATELFGKPMRLEARMAETERTAATGKRADDQPKPLQEDPVVQAFAKHLGGEVVDPRKR